MRGELTKNVGAAVLRNIVQRFAPLGFGEGFDPSGRRLVRLRILVRRVDNGERAHAEPVPRAVHTQTQ